MTSLFGLSEKTQKLLKKCALYSREQMVALLEYPEGLYLSKTADQGMLEEIEKFVGAKVSIEDVGYAYVMRFEKKGADDEKQND